MPIFVLIHSPLAGLLTWSQVANALWARDLGVVTPGLTTDPEAGPPYWRQHVEAITTSLETLTDDVPPDEPIVLVGHSGAGALLPAIADALLPALADEIARPVAAQIYCDCDLPRDGASRLDGFGTDEERTRFRASAVDGILPPPTEAALEPLIPDPALRAQFMQDLRPTPLAVYEELIPAPGGLPAAACGYLGFRDSRSTYAAAIQQARDAGWPLELVAGGHFEMLADPEAVAETLLRLTDALGVFDGDPA